MCNDVQRINAKRRINRNANHRGYITELLIQNYKIRTTTHEFVDSCVVVFASCHLKVPHKLLLRFNHCGAPHTEVLFIILSALEYQRTNDAVDGIDIHKQRIGDVAVKVYDHIANIVLVAADHMLDVEAVACNCGGDT